MGFQNRVMPDGSLHINPSRGLFVGNRGIIHDPNTKLLTGMRWTTNAWVCCALEYKERSREVWGRNHSSQNGMKAGWTELFFLDEVTALAAGHRPCNTCRREHARTFQHAFARVFGTGDAKSINIALHAERWHSATHQAQGLSAIDLPGLPDGTVVQSKDAFFALKNRQALPWSFSGYGKPVGFGRIVGAPVRLVTPRSVLAVLREGYKPQWHMTA